MILSDVLFDTVQAELQAHTSVALFSWISWVGLRRFRTSTWTQRSLGFAKNAISKYEFYHKNCGKESIFAEVWVVMERMGYEDMCRNESSYDPQPVCAPLGSEEQA